MHLDVKMEYWLQLTPDEFALVGRALAGKLKDADREQARELSNRLAQARLKWAEAAHTRAQTVIDTLEAEGQ